MGYNVIITGVMFTWNGMNAWPWVFVLVGGDELSMLVHGTFPSAKFEHQSDAVVDNEKYDIMTRIKSSDFFKATHHYIPRIVHTVRAFFHIPQGYLTGTGAKRQLLQRQQIIHE